MASHHPGATTAPDPHLVPPILATWLSVFRPCFTAPVWNRILVLVAGAVLAPGKRTVTQVLRVMGLADEPSFRRYHEVLSRARWDGQAVARRLLLYIIERLLPDGEVVIGIDDTIERRWGARINARGIYRDPVRSSKGHFVKTSGLRWLSLMVAVPIPWAKRTWALPFLTILAPSARWSEANGKRHKTLTTWARQAILESIRISGVFTPRQLERNRRNCRSPSKGTIFRRVSAACHQGRESGSATAGAHHASSIASAGAWRSAY